METPPPPDRASTPSHAAASTWTGDAEQLAAQLRKALKGEVRFDAGTKALYATDGSNYRQVPLGVVFPTDTEDVLHTITVCREFDAPITARGGGTSLAGQCCNVSVSIDFSRHFHRILEIDPQRRLARVQPGLVLDKLQNELAPHRLLFGPDPATHTHCTFGGMIGNNSCGVHSVLSQLRGPGARVSDNLAELEILTYDGYRMRVGQTSDSELTRIIQEGGRRGEIYAALRSLRDRYAPLIRARFPRIPRRVSGYNLDELLPEKGFHVARALAGSEGTCATILEATVMLLPNPSERVLLVIGYPDVYEAGDHVPHMLTHNPIGVEGLDAELVGFMKKRELHPEHVLELPPGEGWLYVEFGADSAEEATEQARQLMAELEQGNGRPPMKLFTDAEEQAAMWEVRESGLGATAFVPGLRDAWPGWEDSAVPPEKVGPYLRELRKLLRRHGYHAALYGHFGQGCIHCRIDFDLVTRPGLERYRAFLDEAADLVIQFGGVLSGEHGDGQARGELLPKLYGPELVQAFREFKAIWDPRNRMNPGKVIDSRPILSNLRLGTGYNPSQPETHFQFPMDHGSFARAALRCVGVGKCRREEGGTMCPSYMVTREEQDTTRGRAHALFEMLQGEVLTDGWRSEHVKETLELCLACKGCKGECPVNVDMATYKAEFLAHYYKGRLRPRVAYSMGLIHRWARIGSRMPRLANFVTQTPGLSRLAKWIAGIAPERQMPPFALESFTDWFARRGPHHPDRPRVLLWPDTFNNHWHPHILQAAVAVLEDAGFQVLVPQEALCCGRPLYDYGMLDTAKTLLRRILKTLRSEMADGVPVIGLEPSCLTVFRDELTGLFPQDQDAQRLAQLSFTLAEFLQQKVGEYHPPRLHRKILVHGHCHHKAIMKLGCDEQLLSAMGLEHQVLDSGCCGMAGSFGFEEDKYDLSVRCGERVLLPAVRSASEETLILADGFSCQEQIRQLTNRKAVHLAEVLHLALREGEPSRSSGTLRSFQKSVEPKPESVKEIDMNRRAEHKGRTRQES
jgi:FAD/FMN-containing dehydrogenase/Fe-S oxidoreductase